MRHQIIAHANEVRRRQRAHFKKMLKVGVPSEKASRYYLVSKIIKHHINPDGKVWYFVSWEEFSEDHDSWIPESNMDGAIDLVQEYNLRQGLAPSSLVLYAGAEEPSSETRGNWVSPGDVLAQLNTFLQHKRFKSDLRVVEFTSSSALDSTDSLYILVVDFHVYIVLSLPSTGQLFIADGSNTYIMKEEARRHVHDMLEVTSCNPLLFINQEGQDHCGSSAVAIGLEFARLYRTKEPIGTTMMICRWYLERAKQKFHKTPTSCKLTTRESNIYKRPHLRCDICGWGTLSTKRAGLSLHMRRVHAPSD